MSIKMSNLKIFCKICNKEISKNQKARHEKSKKHLRNSGSANISNLKQGGDNLQSSSGGDLQTISSKLPGFPWAKYKGEHHLPGHNYTGPGTRLDIRLDENNIPKPGEEPINRVDQSALKHDIAYNNPNIRDRQKADIDLIQDLNEIKNPTFRERLDKAIVKNVMKAKILVGGGQSPIALGGELEINNNNNNNNKQEILAEELHHEYRKPSKFLKVKVFQKDDIWSADLIETVDSKNNNNFKYILTVIDLYTRYAWVVPLKNKTGESTKEAFESLFESNPDRIPNKLWVDHGNEFYNKIMDKFLKENEIEIYSTQNEGKAVVIERFNRTIKHWMYKKFTERGNRIWIDILPELMDKYNNKVHTSIGFTPKEASDNPKLILEKTNENNNENHNVEEKQKFNVGDRVRIFKYKKKFEKGVTYKFSKEIFIIKKIYPTHPITYKIYDLKGEEILGKMYQNELLKTSF